MEGLYLEQIVITFTDGNELELRDVRYAQKGNIMLFEDAEHLSTIVNFDNVLYFNYIEAIKKEEQTNE